MWTPYTVEYEHVYRSCYIMFKVKGQIYKLAYNFGTLADTGLILGMPVRHIEVHIFRGDLSRSSFKVKFTK